MVHKPTFESRIFQIQNGEENLFTTREKRAILFIKLEGDEDEDAISKPSYQWKSEWLKGKNWKQIVYRLYNL